MDNERPNERTWWSSRLEEPGALPGTGLTDKEAAWDKLYERLKNVRKTGSGRNIARFPERSDDGRPSSELLRHAPPRSGPSVLDNEPVVRFESETPRRRGMIWLWAAAACFLLIVVPAALLLKNGHRSLREGIPPIPVATQSDKKQASPTDKSSSNPSMAVTPQRPGHIGRVDPNSKEGVRPSPKEEADPRKEMAHTRPRLTAPEKALPTPGPAHPTMHRPDLNKLLVHDADTLTLVFAPRLDLSKPLTVTAATPPKKAQRVVHINELEPPQPTPATVKGPRQKPGGLRFGFAPQETFRPSTTYVEPEAHSILSQNEPLVRWP